MKGTRRGERTKKTHNAPHPGVAAAPSTPLPPAVQDQLHLTCKQSSVKTFLSTHNEFADIAVDALKCILGC